MTEEVLLYDVVHDYIIAENFASDTEGANKVMLKLSDELMQEIYERTMTASEKRKDTMLKKKYDDSYMKKNMQAQYGKEEGKKVYFATIRKQAMEGYKGTADLSKSHPEAVKKVEKNIEKGLGEKVPGGKMGVKKEDVNPFVQSSLEALGSIVKKKSNLGEEGYDHLRDRGMVRPSKDKKDGTSYPPSAEMRKTQKVNKGPSAAEIVRQKYGKAIMGIK